MKKVQSLHRLSLRQKIEVVQHVLEHLGNFRSHLQKHSQKPIYWTVILNKRDTRPITTINPNLGHHEISPRPPTDTTIDLAFWQGWFDKENFLLELTGRYQLSMGINDLPSDGKLFRNVTWRKRRTPTIQASPNWPRLAGHSLAIEDNMTADGKDLTTLTALP